MAKDLCIVLYANQRTGQLIWVNPPELFRCFQGLLVTVPSYGIVIAFPGAIQNLATGCVLPTILEYWPESIYT